MLLNDDYTPMEFVVAVLEDFFPLSGEAATSAMFQTHRLETYEIATMARSKVEMTVALIHERAQKAGHPFKCVLQDLP